MWADLWNWVHATHLRNTGWHKALYVPPELLPRGKIHSSNVPSKMQLFDLCCFQGVHPWSVRTNQSFCLTTLGKGWPLQWLGCPQQMWCAFLSELGKAQKRTVQRWQTADWTCFISSSHAFLYTKREQIFCHLRLCWLSAFWQVCCFDSPKAEDGSALTRSLQHLLLSVLSNAIWILEISYSWKKAMKSSPDHLWETCVDFPLDGWLMHKCLEELSPWTRWENSGFELVCKGIPGGLCLPAPFSWQSLIPLLCN